MRALSRLAFTFLPALVSVTFGRFADLFFARLVQVHPHAYLHYLVKLCHKLGIWRNLSALTCAPRGGVWTKPQPVFRVRCPKFWYHAGVALYFDDFSDN